jgi:hypothetical protein
MVGCFHGGGVCDDAQENGGRREVQQPTIATVAIGG